MKSVKSFLRKIDVFGVPYSFKYREKEKYTTSFGGLFIVLFIFAALFMGIYYFIPFYNREKIILQYISLLKWLKQKRLILENPKQLLP